MKLGSGKEQMSVQKQILYSKTLNGIFMICAGMFEFFDNILCQFLCVMFLAVACYLSSKELLSKKEKYDEMARKNLAEAESFAFGLLVTLFCIFSIFLNVSSYFVSSLSFRAEFLIPLLFVIIGIADLMVGIKFRQLEEE